MTDCGHELYWRGMYRGNFDLITPESIAHPAKMAPRLCFRILEHLEELGLLHQGDTILDPMAGTGMTAIVACAKGYRAVTVELEEKFIGFQKANKEYAARRLHKDLDWTILQGDARNLSQMLVERGLVTLTSPPYEAQIVIKDKEFYKKWCQQHGRNPDTIRVENINSYGTTPGQIGNLPDRPITITSPPYGDAISFPDNRIDISLIKNEKKRRVSKHSQLADGMTHYGISEGQIGSLPDKPLVSVTSPPYTNETQGGHTPTILSHGRDFAFNAYGQSDGQIGQDKGEDYLSAMRLVYAEIAKVASVLACVLKDPTRNGKIRLLGNDTWDLLEATGWKIVDYHYALLFNEIHQVDLFGDTQKKIKGRLSFFKRLSWKKGQPVAAGEHILVALRKNDSFMDGLKVKPALIVGRE